MSMKISVAELKDEANSGRAPQMVDVRTPGEYAAGHIPCAINIPMEQFESRRKDLRLEQGVVLICKSGTRAGIVAGWLDGAAGITDNAGAAGTRREVKVLTGGTDAWIAAGQETVITVRTRWSLERQVRLVAGLLVLTGSALVLAGVHAGLYLALFVGAGLTIAGATDFCMMGVLLAKMPWNQARTLPGGSSEACCGS